MKRPFLETARLVVRMAEPEDLEAVVRFFVEEREFLRPFSPLPPEGFYTEGFWADRILRNREEFEQGRSLRMFLFERMDPSTVLGMTNFTEMVRGPFQACHLGYALREGAQGKGFVSEALRAGIRHVFGEMNLHRIMANYMPRNERSGRVLKTLGFRVEGYACDYLQIAGRWEDHILTSLVNPDWTPAVAVR